MFLNRNPRNGSHFLILMKDSAQPELPMRGLVRRTALHQFGQFMMGHVTLTGKTATGPWKCRVSLSGCYGNMGLTVDVPRLVYEKGTDVPPELVDAWNNGEGWNGAGREAPAMREWGLSLMRKEAEAKALRPKRKRATGRMRADEASRYYYSNIRPRMASHMKRTIEEQWTSEKMQKHWSDHVLGGPDWERTPRWIHDRTIGANDSFTQLLYMHFLDWRVWIRGVGLVSPADMKAGKYEYSKCDAERGTHCWKDTGKPWNPKPEETMKEATHGEV